MAGKKSLFICIVNYQLPYDETVYIFVTPVIAATGEEAHEVAESKLADQIKTTSTYAVRGVSSTQVHDKFLEEAAREVLGWDWPEIIE